MGLLITVQFQLRNEIAGNEQDFSRFVARFLDYMDDVPPDRAIWFGDTKKYTGRSSSSC